MTAATRQRVLLSAKTLAVALEGVECASVVVCGWRAALIARRLVSQGECDLKVYEDDGRDADAWELF